MKGVLRGRGQSKREFEPVAVGKVCFEGMKQLKRGLDVVVLGEIK